MIHFDQLRAFYEQEGREELRLNEESPQRLEFNTAVQYLERYLPDKARILDSCSGSGVYAFHFANKGYPVVAGDIVPYNVEKMREKQAAAPCLENIYQGDARKLSQFEDGTFDAVLCMGALYHLDKAEDRRSAVSESLRVLREQGIIACTYMNRYAVIMNNLAPDLGNMDEILQFSDSGKEGVFFASTPEETAQLLTGCGVEILCHVALDGIATFLYHTTGLLNDDGFARWQQYHQRTCDVPSLLGYGYHNLIIGRKG